MKNSRSLGWLSLLLAGTSLAACEAPPTPTAPATPPAPAAPAFDEDSLVFFEALPEPTIPAAGTPEAARIELGRMLFHDPRLSKAHDVSCNSCHGLTTYGVDNEKTSKGHKGQRGGRNSPTVYNARFYIAQFWDGRAKDLTDQAKGPVLNPIEMAMPSEGHVLKVLESIPGYVEKFKVAFPADPKPLTYQNAAAAIAAFEENLLTPSRFDKFLRGDKTALTDAEKAGLMTFVGLGCTTCHNGPAVGGSSMQRIGQIVPYDDTEDPGRFGITQAVQDKQVFKVPSLRNIEKTAPYFHNGRFATLDETVHTMAKHQLGKHLHGGQVEPVITFLKTLTGELPTEYAAKPELPPSGPNTPKPDPS